MDTVEFILALVTFSVIAYWYCVNEGNGAGGRLGLFALDLGEPQPTSDAASADTRRYRPRQRATPDPHEKLSKADGETRAYRAKPVETPIDRSRRLAAKNPLEDLR